MKITKQTIALKYRNGIILPERNENCQNQHEALMFQAEVMRLGYIFNEDLFSNICQLSIASLDSLYRTIIPILWDLKGADKKWRLFYPKFPKQVMKASELELYSNAVFHYMSYGRWLPTYAPSRRLPQLESIKFIELQSVSEKDCLSVFTELLASNISLSESSLAELEWFVESYDVVLNDHMPAHIPFKETLCTFIGTCLTLKKDFALSALQNSTDVLRVMTHLSGGDVSLAENTKFRSWKRPERKMLVDALEKSIREDDVARHGEKWKRAFHGLHIGDYAKRVPKSYAIADKLRNGKLSTFNGQVEVAIARSDVDEISRLLGSRPGELARRLDHLLRLSNKEDAFQLVKLFDTVAHRIDTRVLLQLLDHLQERSKPVKRRIVMPKGMQAKARIVNKELPALAQDQVHALLTSIRSALMRKFGTQLTLGKVWIDPRLKKCPVPMAQRSASETLRSVARGTRLDLGAKKTLRLFVWWVGQDIDLSCVLYNEGFKKIGHLSYTNLKMKSIHSCHSGDITYAPKGAAEFIDIDMDSAQKAGVRYVMMNVIDFTGLKFSGYKECFAGWMTRDYPNKNEVYDPKTVEQKIDLRSPSHLAAPVLFDIVEKEAIWLDLQGHVKSRLPNNVESNAATIEDLSKAALLLSDKLNLYDLFELHAKARGEKVDSKDSADTIFAVDEGITPFDLTKIGAEFIA